MRTKTLLIAVAALAIGAATSMAQTYSQNVVGYVNINLPVGQTMVANQLDVDGTGTNNTIFTCMGTNLPNGLQVLVWNGGGWTSTKWAAGSQKWSLNNQLVTNAMQPGAGFFVNSTVATNVTLVGTVIQGTNVAPIIAGYQVIAPNIPSSGGIQSVFGYNPTKNDQMLIWSGSGFVSHKYGGSSWSGGEPTFAVGQCFLFNAVGATNWTKGFVVP